MLINEATLEFRPENYLLLVHINAMQAVFIYGPRLRNKKETIKADAWIRQEL